MLWVNFKRENILAKDYSPWSALLKQEIRSHKRLLFWGSELTTRCKAYLSSLATWPTGLEKLSYLTKKFQH